LTKSNLAFGSGFLGELFHEPESLASEEVL